VKNMEIDALIKKIAEEKAKAETELLSSDGLLRLQEVAAKYEGEYKLIWSKDLLQAIQNRPTKPVHGTNLPDLDAIIGGFREQQLITISAHSKHGKTSFGVFLLENMTDLNPVMIPLEQSNEEIVEQRFENGYSIPNFLSPSKLAPRVDVDWIEQRIIEGIAKHNTKLVLIDHLGYIDNHGPGGKFHRENLAYRLGEVMRSLKNIAKRWNVVIVLLCHISQSDESKPPTLEDIKNSSDILQESDMVIMLWRKNTQKKKVRVYENKTLVSVMANRRTGKNGNVGLVFNTTTGRYDPDNDWVRQMEEMAQAAVQADDTF
jgi:replicative DNA helicase